MAAPRQWTPLFFLDDAVALAAGHRPCGLCRRTDYRSYLAAVGEARSASDLNGRLAVERHRPGRGLDRASDRILWRADIGSLPDGTVVVDPDGTTRLVVEDRLMTFSFDGWLNPKARSRLGEVIVLTPPVSVEALRNGFEPVLHPSAR